MKKRILLVIICLCIVNMPLIVLAGGKKDDQVTTTNAQPLTCIYGSTKNAYRFMLVQNSDGSHKVSYILLEGNVWSSNFPTDNDNWTITNAKIKLESDVLTSCPGSVDKSGLGIGTLTFYSDADKGSFKLGYSKNESTYEKDDKDKESGVDTNTVFEDANQNSSCSSDEKYIYKCSYKDLVTICFNETNIAFEYANPESVSQLRYLGVQLNFTLSDLLEQYHANNDKCPTVYQSNQQGIMDNKLHLSITETDDGFAGVDSSENSASGNVVPFTPVEEQSCSSLLGSPSDDYSPAFYLTKAFHVLKYAGIVILIVMSVIDFVTAITSNDNDALIKATKKTITRLVLCVIIFMLPYLIGFILELLNDRAIDMCGIG